MKILWFTNTPSLYKIDSIGYHGGGWIESLEEIISKQKDIQLGISFFHSDLFFKIEKNRTIYYPISLYNTIFKKIKHNIFYESAEKQEVKEYLKVIDDFKPDVIHIFGSEKSFGLICNLISIPVIIHIQGILNTCYNAYYPPGISKFELIVKYIFNPNKLFHFLRGLKFFKHNANRERNILQQCKYSMGRTKWDKDISLLFSPKRKYFHCNELLRKEFYNQITWVPKKNKKIVITSTLSKVLYKGADTILKTAEILKVYFNIEIEWNIYGINEYKELESLLGLNFKNLNVNLRGILDSANLVIELLASDIYVHTSYIDNSPNSVCEAQLLGIPVIATNVGGIPSLIQDGVNGFLVPANDPYILAIRINEISTNKSMALQIGNCGKKTALERHNQEQITNNLLNTYNFLINDLQ